MYKRQPLLFMPVIEYVIRTTVCGENGKGENIRIDFQMEENQPVSYTHLDVYKRQGFYNQYV